ncbi:MAG TPA: hypothetical protein VFO16_17680 [Pseudonocardiaceae bacterium]|nr:hypothetical protein [Pseudonocardiaceae bacterium]
MTLILTMIVSLSQATSPEPASAVSQQCAQASVKQPPVDLQAVIDEFVRSIPAADTRGYADPTKDPDGRKALVEGFSKTAGGDLIAACQALAPVGYQVALTTDRRTGRGVVLLRESHVARAWGLYLVSWPPSGNPSTLIVEAPHACPDTADHGCLGGDRFVHLVAVKVFQEANARYLFINGADRRANGEFKPEKCAENPRCADMAHQRESPFEKIHEKAVSSLGPHVKVYQSHRFLSREHKPPDNVLPGTSATANVVVSAGHPSPSPLARDVAHGIEAAERSVFHVCLFTDRQDCANLGATTNVQKDHVPEGQFVHVEASDEVVRSPCEEVCRRDELARAIAVTMK